MKKFINCKTLLLAMLGNLFALSGKAQCATTTVLNINTGITTAGVRIGTATADPLWTISAVTANVLPYGGPGAATVIPPSAPLRPGLWYTSTVAEWISIANFSYPTTSSGSYGITYKRKFRLCQKDSVIFRLNIANDNYCTDIRIDGVSVLPAGSFPQAPTASTTPLIATAPCNFGRALLAGIHELTITNYNFAQNTPVGQPQALLVEGDITSAASVASIVTNFADTNCTCVTPPCSDTCYWRVDGNTISGGRNTFGTLNNNDVRIKTFNTDRGIMTKTGLLGWNTMSPTAYLHVNCLGNNAQQSGTSDIRFENLEQGTGSVLVIDDATGYVFNSRVKLGSVSTLMAENKRLSDEVTLLKAQVAMIQSNMEKQAATQNAMSSGNSSSYLIKNVPNPFGNSTVIEYFLEAAAGNAQLLITDMNGKLIRTIQLTQTGMGSVTVDMAGLSSGMYHYSLQIDGKQLDAKKMILKP